MEHADLAQAAAVVGALGAAMVILSRGRLDLGAGVLALALAELGLALSLVPTSDLERLVASPARVVLLALAVLALLALAAAFACFPALVAPVLLVAAPFRIPVELGSQEAFLLVPLYAVLSAAVLALLYRTARGRQGSPLPLWLAAPAALFLALSGISLLWSRDLRAGTIQLLFFLFPFAALVAAVARAPLARWTPRTLAVLLVSLASLFAAIGLYQAATHRLFFARDLEVANAYTSYFRVTSLFKDPSLYGRQLVIAVAVLLVAVLLRRLHPLAGWSLIGFLFAGLWFSYSQSSLATLFVVSLALAVCLADRATRRLVVVGAVALVIAGGAFVAATTSGDPARKVTSGRSRLIAVTTEVFERHPVAGVGIGSQPRASREEAATRLAARRNASHTTPLTIAAELGVIGLLAYLGLLAAIARLFWLAVGRDRALGFGLAAVFFALLVHSLSYSGFFEDALTWGSVALGAALLAPSAALATACPRVEAVDDGRPRPDVAGAVDDLRGRVGRAVRGLARQR